MQRILLKIVAFILVLASIGATLDILNRYYSSPLSEKVIYFAIAALMLTSGLVLFRLAGKGVAMQRDSFLVRFPKLLAFLEKYGINGVGLKFYTWCDQKEDGSVLASQWFAVAWIPVIPVRQVRIRVETEKDRIYIPFFVWTSKLVYERFEELPLNRKLVSTTRMVYYLLFLPLLIVPIFLYITWLVQNGFNISALKFWSICAGLFLWGMTLMYFVEKWNETWFLEKYRQDQST